MRIENGQPDLVFLLVLAWSINAELDEGVRWAFIGGICQDLLSFAPLGTSTLGMLLLVFGIGGLGRQVYGTGLVMLAGLVMVGTLVQKVVFMGVIALNGMPVDFFAGLQRVILPTMLYNLVFIWPVYWLVRRIQRHTEEPKIG